MEEKEKLDFEQRLDKINNMSVQRFQNELEKHNIECKILDNYVFDLATALKKSN